MIKNFQKCFAEIKDIEMKKLYNKKLDNIKNTFNNNSFFAWILNIFLVELFL